MPAWGEALAEAGITLGIVSGVEEGASN